jgi:uridine phosphorylase
MKNHKVKFINNKTFANAMSFPNLKNKHGEDAMFSPAEFLKHTQAVGLVPKGKPCESVIMYYSKKDPSQYLPKFTLKKNDFFASDFYIIEETDNKIAVMSHFGVGAPAAVTALEELVAWGVKNFITIGTAGALQKHLRIGDLVVCDQAIRDEGTSHHYLPHSKYAFASEDITKKIRKALDSLGKKYIVGTSWTTDAIYRETVSEARQYQREKVLTVEMEASALFAVGKYRNVNAGAVFAISDSLAEMPWKPDFYHQKLDESKRILFCAAVNALSENNIRKLA